MTKVILLSKKEITEILSLNEAIPVIEKAFFDFASGKAILPSAVGFPVKEHSGEMHIKSGYMPELNTVAVKVASSFAKNSEKNLPSVLATILVFDSNTGEIKALMDGIHITAVRTAAVGAVAAKYLSKENSKTAGIIGSGVQAKLQLKALLEVRSIKKAKVYSINKIQLQEYKKELNGFKGIQIELVSSPKEACENSDIIISCTPSLQPIIKAEWISFGTHINAIGSDNPKKQELFCEVLKKADKVVADRLEQCRNAGEIHHALKEKIVSEQKIIELGDIILNKKNGRENPEEITVFDSTGIAVQDISVSALVLSKAEQKNLGKIIEV